MENESQIKKIKYHQKIPNSNLLDLSHQYKSLDYSSHIATDNN